MTLAEAQKRVDRVQALLTEARAIQVELRDANFRLDFVRGYNRADPLNEVLSFTLYVPTTLEMAG